MKPTIVAATGRRLLAAVMLLLLAGNVAADDLRPGHVAWVTREQAEFGLRDDPDILLPMGTRIYVTEVRGAWVGSYFLRQDEKTLGWILDRHLRRLVVTAPSEAECSAMIALGRMGLRVEPDRYGHAHAVHADNSSPAAIDLAPLEQFARVVSLDLGGTHASAAMLEPLRKTPSLERLYLDGCDITDEGLGHLQNLKKLEVLVLAKSHITGPGLQRLARLTSLRTLNLSGCEVSDEDALRLAALESLEVLALAETKLRGEGLQHLRSLPALRVLNLNSTSIDDDDLRHLEGMPALRMLYVKKTGVTSEGIDKLDERLHSCAIYD